MEISIYEPVDLITTLMKTTINGMTDRIRRLRQESFDTQPSLSIERALIETEFYKENEGKYPIPILRALNFLEICKRKTIYIGEDELIVGEDIAKLASLIRSYFALGGHHIQFNIVDTATLHAAQKHPEEYRDLLVRVAGYSDYFNDMNTDLQYDVIARTAQETF
jgi:hypothetical protein